jgi:hypothetical protein
VALQIAHSIPFGGEEPILARMAHAIEDPMRRSSVLLALAQALPL